MARQRFPEGLPVALLSVLCLLSPLGDSAEAKIAPMPRRFTFKIDPMTPVKDLLPPAPQVQAPTSPWLVKGLAQVPEIMLAMQDDLKLPDTNGLTQEETRKAFLEMLTKHNKAMEKTARLIAQINLINQQDPEYLVRVLRKTRPDLEGLPFILGDACRQSKSRSQAFLSAVSLVQAGLNARAKDRENKTLAAANEEAEVAAFWNAYHAFLNHMQMSENQSSSDSDENHRERIAALMQMLAPKSLAMRRELAGRIGRVENAGMSLFLARLAIFWFDAQIRQFSVSVLKGRPAEEYTATLLGGLRHPWPAVAQDASKAIIQLGRKDLVPQLVAILQEPDPRAPIEKDVAGEKQTVVRELVRINHHRNCLLCHPPGNTPDVKMTKFGRPTEIVAGAVPSPGHPFPSSPSGYDPNSSPDILVRADITYLRQDFSLLQKVPDAAPWPEMQRFDFLVRTRKVSGSETKAYRDWLKAQGPGYVVPHHQAVHTALRELTGRDVTEPTAKAWRAALAE